ncbi:hypothetical protein [Burkholderia phage FLC9]|nr:hypothetical protein [Burkholderia phage FLC9]
MKAITAICYAVILSDWTLGGAGLLPEESLLNRFGERRFESYLSVFAADSFRGVAKLV